MSAVAARDKNAFAELLERYLDKVHHFILRSTNAPADTDDLVQETFLRVWSKAEAFAADQASVSTWLLRIARNQCIDNHRRTQARPAGHSVADSEAQLELMPAEHRSTSSEIEHERTLTQLREAISALPERQRTALTLCQLQGRSNAEAAKILDIKVSAVESLLARARRSLKGTLTLADPSKADPLEAAPFTDNDLANSHANKP